MFALSIFIFTTMQLQFSHSLEVLCKIPMYINFNYPLSILCTILALSFLTYEFYIFIVKKPTLISTKKINLRENIFPEVSICPEPAFSLEGLNSNGYNGVYMYYVGNMYMTNTQRGDTEDIYTGWGGHGALNQSEMLKKLIITENPSDMIGGTKISYKDKKNIHNYGPALLSERPIVYPIGQCIQLAIPSNMKGQAVMMLGIYLMSNTWQKRTSLMLECISLIQIIRLIFYHHLLR